MENNNTQQELISELKTFNETLKKQQSSRRLLRNGMLNGVGFVIGTTILAGIGISILVFFLGDLPIVGSLVEQVKINRDK